MTESYALNKQSYFLYFGIVASGLVWLLVNIFSQGAVPTVCLLKNVTGIPCPTCGTTDSITYLLNGDIMGAFMLNPLGIPLSLLILFFVVKVLFELVIKKRTFVEIVALYETFTRSHRKKFYFLLFIIFINWIWVLAK